VRGASLLFENNVYQNSDGTSILLQNGDEYTLEHDERFLICDAID